MKQIKGQLSFTDIFSAKVVNEKNEGLGEQCESCDVTWCSIICFQRRGYIWDRVRRFAKDDAGNKLRKPIEARECKLFFWRLIGGLMTIREVLEADWTVSWFEVTVRQKESSKYICKYLIGKDVKSSRYERFVCETAAGDIYKDTAGKVVVIDKNIQFRHLTKRPQGKEMCAGVLVEEIPKEILDLIISHMSPSGCGRSDDMHGYYFTCYVDHWGGISGENEQMELTLELWNR